MIAMKPSKKNSSWSFSAKVSALLNSLWNEYFLILKQLIEMSKSTTECDNFVIAWYTVCIARGDKGKLLDKRKKNLQHKY